VYIPNVHRVTDAKRLQAFVRHHSFATLVTCPAGPDGPAPFASHLPFLLHVGGGAHGVLRAHMARANPQWRHFRPGHEVMAVFLGPHAFVSSNWYAEPARMVPTWNYTAVHAYGTARLIEEPAAVYALLRDLMAVYQPEGSPMPLSPEHGPAADLVQGIVAFEVEVTRWEGKFKLSQNRSAEDRRRVREALEERGAPDDRAVADLMGNLQAETPPPP
jgi:transcriptional regulator